MEPSGTFNPEKQGIEPRPQGRSQPLQSNEGSSPIMAIPPEILKMLISFLPEDERPAVREVASWFRDNIVKPSTPLNTSTGNSTLLKAKHASERVLFAAAQAGAVPFLDWAKTHQMPISNRVCIEAAGA